MSKGEKRVKLHIDLISSIFFILFSLFFLLSMEKEVYVGSDDGVNARTFPTIVLFTILFISIFILIREIVYIALKKERRVKVIVINDEIRSLLIFLLLILYALCIRFMGFIFSSVIFSPLLSFSLGERKWRNLITVALLSLIIALVFRYLLNVRF